MTWTRDQIAARAAEEVPPGATINLGIGLPTLVAGHICADGGVMVHSENGLLGMGPFPFEGDEDPHLINAGKQTVTVVAGGAFFDSAMSFSMIRGGHLDVVMLGAMQVGSNGDIANWSIPGGRTMGIGGAMDLATGCRRVVALMTHTSKRGAAKLVDRCTFPLTAAGAVNRVITELGVFDPAGDGFVAVQLAPDVTLDFVRERTDAPVTRPETGDDITKRTPR